MTWHPITVCEVTRFNSDWVHEERAAFVITFVSKRMCYSSRVTALAYEVVRNVKTGDSGLGVISLRTMVKILYFLF